MREQQFELESIKMQFKLFINISLRIYLFYFICSSLKSTRICGWINISEQFSLSFRSFFAFLLHREKLQKGILRFRIKKKLHQEFQRTHFKVIFKRKCACKIPPQKSPFQLNFHNISFHFISKRKKSSLKYKKRTILHSKICIYVCVEYFILFPLLVPPLVVFCCLAVLCIKLLSSSSFSVFIQLGWSAMLYCSTVKAREREKKKKEK